MNQILYVHGEHTKQLLGVNQEVFRLRHDTFVQRLGWDISSTNGMERDRFDDLNPYHIVIRNSLGEVQGCWRALPTKGSYMLRSVFPELLQGESVPEGDNVWEISRLAIRKGRTRAVKGFSSPIAIELLASLFQFAKAHGIDQYVAVTTVAVERILRNLGLTVRRLGNGKSLQIGVERSVAIWLEVNEKMKPSLQ